jgi:hypothetical protein
MTGAPLSCIPLRCRSGTARAFLLLICLLIIPGCADSPTEIRPVPIPPLPTPATTLKIMADAYERRDIDRYEACLSDDFLHFFDPCDWCPPPSGIQIGKEDELECARAVFECSCVSSIEMDLRIDQGPWATEGGLGYRCEPDIRITVGGPEPAGTTSVTWAELKVLFARDEIPCDPHVYRVSSAYLDIEFIINPADSPKHIVSGIAEACK